MNASFGKRGADTGHPNPIGSPIRESATKARQGQKVTPMLKVLAAGLILAFAAWGVAEWWGEATDPPAAQTATPPAGDAQPQNPGAGGAMTPEASPSGENRGSNP
jgi:hypothetical protein